MGRLADLPEDVLIEGRRVAESFAAMEEERRQASKSTKIQVRRKAMLQVRPSCLLSLCVVAVMPHHLQTFS